MDATISRELSIYMKKTTDSFNKNNNIRTTNKGVHNKKNRDAVEISMKGYSAQSQTEEMSATSGKDTLGVTKGESENSYIIHFQGIAYAYRAVERGYVTVNGQDQE